MTCSHTLRDSDYIHLHTIYGNTLSSLVHYLPRLSLLLGRTAVGHRHLRVQNRQMWERDWEKKKRRGRGRGVRVWLCVYVSAGFVCIWATFNSEAATSNCQWSPEVLTGSAHTHTNIHTPTRTHTPPHTVVIESCHFEIFSSTGICSGWLQFQGFTRLFSLILLLTSRLQRRVSPSLTLNFSLYFYVTHIHK